MKRLRILFLVNNLDAGGGQRYVTDVVNRLDPEVYDIRLCSLGEGNYYEGELRVPLLELGTAKQTRNPMKLIPLIRLISEFRPHILHTHLRFADTIGQLVGRALCVPMIISTIHNTAEWPRNPSSTVAFVEDIAVRQADLVIAVSEFSREFIIRYRGVDEHRVMVLPCGVDLAPFLTSGHSRPTTRTALGLSDNEIVFSCTAAFRSIKRHDLVLDVFEELRVRSSMPMRLLLIGTGGSLEQEIRDRVSNSAHRDAITFLNGSKQDIAAYLAASDVFFMHSELEGASIAIVEAMASGLPILVPRLSHFVAQVRDGVDGLLFDFQSREEGVQMATQLASSRVLRSALGTAGKQRAQEVFGIEEHVAKLSGIYLDLHARRGNEHHGD